MSMFFKSCSYCSSAVCECERKRGKLLPVVELPPEGLLQEALRPLEQTVKSHARRILGCWQ